MKQISIVAALSLAATPLFAESHGGGDAAAGEEAFSQCQTCHVVVDDEGNTIAGRKSKTGPTLYGIIGSQAGIVEGFRDGKSLVAAGEAGLVWDEENFVAYVQDPKAFLRTYLDDKKARSKMSYKVREEADAINLYAFLASIGPEMDDNMTDGDADANATDGDGDAADDSTATN